MLIVLYVIIKDSDYFVNVPKEIQTGPYDGISMVYTTIHHY